MHVDFPIAKAQNVQVERLESTVDNGSEVDVAVRQFFRPYVLTLLALAVAFGGWSYGYALCRYLSHSEVTRASLTRAWVEHREGLSVVDSHQLIPPPRLVELALACGLDLHVAHRTPELVLDQPAPARAAYLFSSLIPFRAPPSTNPSLA